MSQETQDIRVWAARQGLDVAPKGRIPASVMAEWQARDTELPDLEVPPGEVIETGGDSEHAPAVKTSLFKRRKKQPTDVPKAVPRRVTIEHIAAFAWRQAGRMLSANPRALPVARVMDMQSPVAGIILNDSLKGTPVDKLLQPLARMSEKGSGALALIGPPLIVGAISANPAIYPLLHEPLKLSLMTWMEVSAPAMKKAEARAKKFAEQYGGVDLDGMIEALFAPPPGSSWGDAASEQEEENIRKAKEQG